MLKRVIANKRLIYVVVIIAVLLIIGWALYSDAAEKTYGNFYNCVVVKVTDGDNITLQVPNTHPIIGDGINVRLRGIDTPKLHGNCEKERGKAKAARDFLMTLIPDGAEVQLVDMGRDSHFQIVADVYYGSDHINEFMVKSGHAVTYDGYADTKNWCTDMVEPITKSPPVPTEEVQ